jgi:deleted-in-malignant-brain-tumors protein 1
VEVHVNGKWGTVCSKYWFISEAKIVCRELGLPEATLALNKAVFPSGGTPVVMDVISCTGIEPSLVNCSYNHVLNNYCSRRHKEVGVVCGKAKGKRENWHSM